MSIQILRNAAGNCINFVGTSNPAYWNACLEGKVNDLNNNKINVINSVRTVDPLSPTYEFYAVDYTEFLDENGVGFTTAQECADYITLKCNVLGNTNTYAAQPTDTFNFFLDKTKTTILVSTGDSFAVQSTAAVGTADGLVTITRPYVNGYDYFTGILPGNITVEAASYGSNQADVVNALNALFNLSALGSGSFDGTPVIPTTQSVGSVTAFGTYTSVVGGVGVVRSGLAATAYNEGFYSVDSISTAGEYFEFTQTGGFDVFATFGLLDITNNSVVDLTNNTVFGGALALSVRMNNLETYAVGLLGKVLEGGFYNTPESKTVFRVGLDTDGRLYISLKTDLNTFQVICRSAYISPVGTSYKLVGYLPRDGSFNGTPSLTVSTVTPAAPLLRYFSIQSPDSVYYYPLFKTAEEANYVDILSGGGGTSSTRVFVDDPSFTAWYLPTTGSSVGTGTAPVNTADVIYTEQVTLTDNLFTPPVFTKTDRNLDELAAVNISIIEGDWVTSVSGLPTGLTYLNGFITGVSPVVTSDYVTNPSDSYTITVTRTNNFGASSGSFNIIVRNLTAPAVAVSGFTWDSSSTPLVDSDTMGIGSVVDVSTLVASGKRIIFPASWVETYVLPSLTTAGDKFFLGVKAGSITYTTIDASDFDFYIGWSYLDTSSHTSDLNGSEVTVSSLVASFYDYAIEVDGTDVHLIGCNFNEINTNPSVNSGGIFGRVNTVAGYTGSLPLTLTVATAGTTADFGSTGSLLIDTPVKSVLTTWDHALCFEGLNDYSKPSIDSSEWSPLYRNGVLGSQPWCISAVFEVDKEGSGFLMELGSATNKWVVQSSGRMRIEYLGLVWESTDLFQVSTWYGVYVEFNGTDTFVVKKVDLVAGVVSAVTGSMLASVISSEDSGSDFDVGRVDHDNLNGDFASLVLATLRQGQTQSTTEITEMVRDPLSWLEVHRYGGSYRLPKYVSTNTNLVPQTTDAGKSTNVWLMGDGVGDSYPYINNQAQRGGTWLLMRNMNSADIENYNIPGLS